MPRSLSSTAIQSGNVQDTAEVWLVCLSIHHADIIGTEYPDGIIRLVNDVVDLNRIISGVTKTFIGCPFEIGLPNEEPDAPANAQLRVDNVDRRIVAAVRGITGPPLVDIEVVLASSPNTVEVGFYDLTMRQVTYDALYVESTLTMEQIFVEPISVDMTPARFPGLF